VRVAVLPEHPESSLATSAGAVHERCKGILGDVIGLLPGHANVIDMPLVPRELSSRVVAEQGAPTLLSGLLH
jgi:hypothetical protein